MHKRETILARTLALVGGLLVAGSAVSAQAADVTPPEPVVAAAPAKTDWRFQATIYGWLSGVSGDVGVRGIGPVGIDISPGQAISDLDGALMGSFGGFTDQFMFLTDFMLTKVSSDGQIRDSAFNYDYSQTQITVQGLVGYMLPLGMPQLQLAPTVGFRYQNLSADLGVSPAFLPVTVSDGGTVQWIDPTVGLYGHYDFNDRWFVTALGDVGGFGVGSNFTWQAFGAVGYNWSKTISTSIGYRAIYEDYESGGFVYDTTQQGAFVGLGIHW